MQKWNRIIAIRTAVNGALEAARAEKKIGKALEADVYVTVTAEDAFLKDMDGVELADIMITSGVVITVGDELKVDVVEAKGEKCERCWKVLSSVGTVAEHPTLCKRCAGVVSKMDITE